jgi:hypothetical protein
MPGTIDGRAACGALFLFEHGTMTGVTSLAAGFSR